MPLCAGREQSGEHSAPPWPHGSAASRRKPFARRSDGPQSLAIGVTITQSMVFNLPANLQSLASGDMSIQSMMKASLPTSLQSLAIELSHCLFRYISVCLVMRA